MVQKRRKMKKVILSNLSNDGERQKRTRLALSNKTSFDKKAYHKKRYAKVKKANEEWGKWFK